MAEDENQNGCKRKRAAKITAGQYQVYLEELQNNEPLRTNKFNPKNPDVLDKTWNSLVLKLNAAGGPVKTVQQWKERFADWKCNVRKKARKVELSRVKTGGGPPDIPLTEMENRLLDLTGRTVVNGIENIPELGLDDNPPAGPSRSPIPELESEPVAPAVTPRIKKNMNQPFSHRKQQQRRVTLATSVKNLVANDSTATNYLQEISASLNTLVKLKQKENLISELKLKLKYPEREFQFLEDSE